jgi:hypothetical protein
MPIGTLVTAIALTMPRFWISASATGIASKQVKGTATSESSMRALISGLKTSTMHKQTNAHSFKAEVHSSFFFVLSTTSTTGLSQTRVSRNIASFG